MTSTHESEAIEVEVLEIDGAVPLAKDEPTRDSETGQPWQNWQGRVRQLDSRWWPLWVILGVIAVALLLTVGVFLGIIFLIFRIIRGFIRAMLTPAEF